MAVSYKGLTIKFGGDTTGLQDALKKVQKESRNTQSDLKEINKSLKFNPGNTELLAQKVRGLNKAYEETKAKLDAYKQAMQQLEDKKARGEQLTEEEQRQYESLQRSILQCENQLESYAKQINETGTELEASKTKLYQFGQTLEDNAESLKKHGERMETAGKAMVGASAAIAGASIAAFNEVDAGLDAVVKATGATGEAADALGESVKNVATTVAGASNDWETIGNTVGEVNTRFGATGQELEGLSELFFKFSEITGVDSVAAVQNADMAMEAFGVDASHTEEVLGVFAKVAQDSGMSADSLMQSLVANGATFREMGLDIDDAAVMLGKFEQAGVPADQMLTGLKKAAANCAKSGDDLGESLTDLTNRLQDPATQAEATQEAIELFGSKAAMSFVDAAESGRVSFTDLQQTLSDYGSTVSDTFNETVNGVDQMKVAEKELQAAAAELGGAFSDVLGPIISDFASVVHDVADAFKSLSPEQQQFVAKSVLVTGAVGGATLGMGKLFQSAGEVGSGLKDAAKTFVDVKGKLSSIGDVTSKFGSFGDKVGEVGGLLSGKLSGGWSSFTGLIAANPIALGVAAVAAAVAGLTWFFTQTETGKQMWSDFTGWISEKWQGVQDFFSGVPAFWGGVWDSVTGKVDEMKANVSQAWESMKTAATEKFNGMKTAISDKVGAIKNDMATKWANIKSGVSESMSSIKSGISEKWDAAKSAVTEKVGAIKSTITDRFGAAKESALSIFGSIKSGITDKINAARDAVRSAIDRMKGFFNFSWSLPHLKLPHVSISGGFSLIPPSAPSFSISWYKKGGVIEPNNPHLIGVGDAPEREWIEPESKLLSLIEGAMRNVSGGNTVSVEVNVSANITGRQSSYEVGQDIGRGITSVMKQRGFSNA